MGEVDFLLLLVPFVHRKIDDPAELEPVLVDQAKFLADLCARRAGELDKILRLAGDKEHRIAVLQAELRAHASVRSGPRLLAMGPRPTTGAAVDGQKDIAEARLPLALRP